MKKAGPFGPAIILLLIILKFFLHNEHLCMQRF